MSRIYGPGFIMLVVALAAWRTNSNDNTPGIPVEQVVTVTDLLRNSPPTIAKGDRDDMAEPETVQVAAAESTDPGIGETNDSPDPMSDQAP